MLKQYFRLATIGLPVNVLSNIKDIIGSSHLNLELKLSLEIQASPSQELKIPSEEYDIILINPACFPGAISNCITEIKRNHPLTEIIVVAFNSSYRSAIHAFRAGVRDILNYPFSPAEVIVSLDRALSYRSLMQKSTYLGDFLEIINLFSDYRKFHSIDELFTKINYFLQHKFNSNSKGILVLRYQSPNNSSIGKFQELYFPSINSFSTSDPNNSTLVNSSELDLVALELNEVEMKNFSMLIQTKKAESQSIYSTSINFKNNSYLLIDLGVYDQYYFVGAIHIGKIEGGDEFQLDLLEQLARMTYGLFQQISNFNVNRQLSHLIYIDDVTGLYNQRKLYLDLDTCIQKHASNKEIFSVLFIDIDHFKRVNDKYGHLIGSALLVELSKELQKIVRETDLIYRYGGDEFVIILPNIDGELACKIGLRILEIIKGKRFNIKAVTNHSSSQSTPENYNPLMDNGVNPNPPISDNSTVILQLSVSIGVAAYPLDASSKEDILSHADDMMYNAKENGRGLVCHGNKIFGQCS